MRKAALGALIAVSACTGRAAFGPAVAYIPTTDNPQCAITDVINGDTVRIMCLGTEPVSTRLVGFDTPETHQPGCAAEAVLGERATRYLETVLRRARVIDISSEGTDKYRRVLARMTLDGRDLADIMVSEGVARYYTGGKRQSWCNGLST